MNHTKHLNHVNTAHNGASSLPLPPTSEALQAIFAQLKPQDIEQFHTSFQLWSLQQEIAEVNQQVAALQQHIAANEASLQAAQPSAIALATLAQLQACGVTDVDLLDSMLARGEDWLDYTMQLLERCESLDIIHGNYTEWCEHALEGAYDWIASMTDEATEEVETTTTPAPSNAATPAESLNEATEELLLQKLMSEEEETIKLPVIHRTPKITQPLAEPLPSPKITRPLSELHASPKITRPLTADQLQTPTAETPLEGFTEVATDEASTLVAETTASEEIATSPEPAPVASEVILPTEETTTPEAVVSPAEEPVNVEDTEVQTDAEAAATADTPIVSIPDALEDAPAVDDTAITEEIPPVPLEEPATPDKEPLHPEMQSEPEPSASPKLEAPAAILEEPSSEKPFPLAEPASPPSLEQPAKQPTIENANELESETAAETESAQPPSETSTKKNEEEHKSPPPSTEEIIADQSALPAPASTAKQQAIVPARHGFLHFLRRLLSWLLRR